MASNPDSLGSLVVRIHVLRQDLEVRWFWVKGYVGNIGNGAADRLAKQEAALPETSVPVQLSPLSVISMVHTEIIKL